MDAAKELNGAIFYRNEPKTTERIEATKTLQNSESFDFIVQITQGLEITMTAQSQARDKPQAFFVITEFGHLRITCVVGVGHFCRDSLY